MQWFFREWICSRFRLQWLYWSDIFRQPAVIVLRNNTMNSWIDLVINRESNLAIYFERIDWLTSNSIVPLIDGMILVSKRESIQHETAITKCCLLFQKEKRANTMPNTDIEHRRETVGNAWIQNEQTQKHKHNKHNEETQSKPRRRESQSKLKANTIDANTTTHKHKANTNTINTTTQSTNTNRSQHVPNNL